MRIVSITTFVPWVSVLVLEAPKCASITIINSYETNQEVWHNAWLLWHGHGPVCILDWKPSEPKDVWRHVWKEEEDSVGPRNGDSVISFSQGVDRAGPLGYQTSQNNS